MGVMSIMHRCRLLVEVMSIMDRYRLLVEVMSIMDRYRLPVEMHLMVTGHNDLVLILTTHNILDDGASC